MNEVDAGRDCATPARAAISDLPFYDVDEPLTPIFPGYLYASLLTYRRQQEPVRVRAEGEGWNVCV